MLLVDYYSMTLAQEQKQGEFLWGRYPNKTSECTDKRKEKSQILYKYKNLKTCLKKIIFCIKKCNTGIESHDDSEGETRICYAHFLQST